jgi:threonine dehydrogenase-like Zn-dependent dehydrogenase
MQAIQFVAPKEIAITDLPEPLVPEPGQALVRAHRMGICGTDLSCYLGRFPFFAFPRTPGHELGLEVVAIADDVTNVKPGDKCSLEPYVIGVHNDGGLRKGIFAVPARKLHPGNDLSYDQLALVETLAIGYHAVQRGKPKPGESVLVIGAGPIGLACLEFLKLMDVKTIVMDMIQSRLDFCQKNLGIQHDSSATIHLSWSLRRSAKESSPMWLSTPPAIRSQCPPVSITPLLLAASFMSVSPLPN